MPKSLDSSSHSQKEQEAALLAAERRLLSCKHPQTQQGASKARSSRRASSAASRAIHTESAVAWFKPNTTLVCDYSITERQLAPLFSESWTSPITFSEREISKTVELTPVETSIQTKLNKRALKTQIYEQRKYLIVGTHALALGFVAIGICGALSLVDISIGAKVAVFAAAVLTEYVALNYANDASRIDNHLRYDDTQDPSRISKTIKMLKGWQNNSGTYETKINTFADSILSRRFQDAWDTYSAAYFSAQDSKKVALVLKHGTAQQKVDFLLAYLGNPHNQGRELFACILEASEAKERGAEAAALHAAIRSGALG